ncbi:MAG: polyphosphate polymerase domain-containing protein [Bacteroidales bacterium]|nr:polyphosphate polymerase domain-containing protein [Bacteroidales bacterium]
MKNIEDILFGFNPISLEEMDSVRLMNRSDIKYIFRIEQLPVFLREITADYRVLEVNNVRLNKYETLYYDTDDFKMYMNHQRGKTNRYKVRLRRYVDSDLNFFEIKFKNNKNRTIKERIRRKEAETVITDKTEKFLHSKTNYDSKELSPKLWANYSRITLVNKNAGERLTIDTNLHYKNETKQKHIPELVIAELKQEKRKNTVFVELMRKYRIKETSISKYCFGVIYLYDNIRMNNFKPNLLNLNKICYGKV